jgi:hypothetical protein
MDSPDIPCLAGMPPEIQPILADKLKRLDFAFTLADCMQPDMPITFASSRFYELTGYTPSEVSSRASCSQ